MLELQSLPAPRVVEELSFESILADAKADFAERMRPHLPIIDDILKLESDPVVKLVESFAMRELLFRARVNDAARSYFLAFATGADLDQLAAMVGVQRMAGEDDERLRHRVQLRIAALGAQGTREHYEFHALTASPLVRAVQASQLAPGNIVVMLWVNDPAKAQAVRDAVHAVINADAVRMLGVDITTAVAKPRTINVTAKITRTRNAPADLAALLRRRLADAFAQMQSMSTTVARSYITTLLHVDGVHAVEFPDSAAPAPVTTIAVGEYPVLGEVKLFDAGAV